MKKTMRSIFKSKKKAGSCANGYATFMALICFLMVLQLLSLASLYISESAYLLKADKRSQIDLAIIDQAKGLIDHNNQIRNCSEDQSGLILEKKVDLENGSLYLKDMKTYLIAEYDNKKAVFYYDDHQINSIEWKN